MSPFFFKKDDIITLPNSVGKKIFMFGNGCVKRKFSRKRMYNMLDYKGVYMYSVSYIIKIEKKRMSNG